MSLLSEVNIGKIVLYSTIVIVFFGSISFQVRKRKQPDLTISQFVDSNVFWKQGGWKYILVGMVGGVVFGLIDNLGIWFGMDAFEPWFRARGFSPVVSAGYGNTLGGVIGTFLATFSSAIVSDLSEISIETVPVWAEAFGVLIGSLLGIFIGKGLTYLVNINKTNK